VLGSFATVLAGSLRAAVHPPAPPGRVSRSPLPLFVVALSRAFCRCGAWAGPVPLFPRVLASIPLGGSRMVCRRRPAPPGSSFSFSAPPPPPRSLVCFVCVCPSGGRGAGFVPAFSLRCLSPPRAPCAMPARYCLGGYPLLPPRVLSAPSGPLHVAVPGLRSARPWPSPSSLQARRPLGLCACGFLILLGLFCLPLLSPFFPARITPRSPPSFSSSRPAPVCSSLWVLRLLSGPPLPSAAFALRALRAWCRPRVRPPAPPSLGRAVSVVASSRCSSLLGLLSSRRFPSLFLRSRAPLPSLRSSFCCFFPFELLSYRPPPALFTGVFAVAVPLLCACLLCAFGSALHSLVCPSRPLAPLSPLLALLASPARLCRLALRSLPALSRPPFGALGPPLWLLRVAAPWCFPRRYPPGPAAPSRSRHARRRAVSGPSAPRSPLRSTSPGASGFAGCLVPAVLRRRAAPLRASRRAQACAVALLLGCLSLAFVFVSLLADVSLLPYCLLLPASSPHLAPPRPSPDWGGALLASFSVLVSFFSAVFLSFPAPWLSASSPVLR